jgi:hypothetical protein
MGVADARVAAAGGGAGKSKKHKTENIFLKGVRSSYSELVAALAEAGGVEEEELYRDPVALEHCSVQLSMQLYEALPDEAPRFEEMPWMMCRLLFVILADEAHVLAAKPGVAEALWVPLVCQDTAALGSRGEDPIPLLPGFHLVVAPFNAAEPFATTVRETGHMLLTPRPATYGAGGTLIKPAIEVTVDDDGVRTWDARALIRSPSAPSAWARQARLPPGAAARARVVPAPRRRALGDAPARPRRPGALSSRCSSAGGVAPRRRAARCEALPVRRRRPGPAPHHHAARAHARRRLRRAWSVERRARASHRRFCPWLAAA